MEYMDEVMALLERVPHAPEQPLPGGATEEELAQFQEETGIFLPTDLRNWLRQSNGPCVGPGSIFGVGSVRPSLNIKSILRPLWKSKQWIPIAGDGCGNYYVIPTQQEFGAGFPVFFIDMGEAQDAPSYIVASDLGHFLRFLLEDDVGRKGWPFDKEMVCKFDPEITRYSGMPFPWA